jgi:hypothetical protein
MKRILREARDAMTPVDPELDALPREVNPTLALPGAVVPPPDGERTPDDDGEYKFWMRDGVTPYRSKNHAYDVFSKVDDGWMGQQMVDPQGHGPADVDAAARLAVVNPPHRRVRAPCRPRATSDLPLTGFAGAQPWPQLGQRGVRSRTKLGEIHVDRHALGDPVKPAFERRAFPRRAARPTRHGGVGACLHTSLWRHCTSTTR